MRGMVIRLGLRCASRAWLVGGPGVLPRERATRRRRGAAARRLGAALVPILALVLVACGPLVAASGRPADGQSASPPTSAARGEPGQLPAPVRAAISQAIGRDEAA